MRFVRSFGIYVVHGGPHYVLDFRLVIDACECETCAMESKMETTLMRIEHVRVVTLKPVWYKGAWHTDLLIDYNHPDRGILCHCSSRLNYAANNAEIEKQSFVLRYNRYARQEWMLAS